MVIVVIACWDLVCLVWVGWFVCWFVLPTFAVALIVILAGLGVGLLCALICFGIFCLFLGVLCLC